MKKGLFWGIKSVLVANIINLLFNLLTNFLLPKYLSTDSYAAIKTYQLLITYCGVLHLGFIDGMYLKFGGKKYNEIEPIILKRNLITLRIFQLFITVILLTIGWILGDFVFLIFACSILPLNMISYFKSLYQAVGEFSKYGRILNINTLCTFMVNIILLFVFKEKNYIYYLFFYVILDFVIWLLLEIYIMKYLKEFKEKAKFSYAELLENIKLGFFLMCGNFSSIVLTTMDRWFVKLCMNTLAFAQYSFAVSIENFLNIAITPVTTTLYNYFCNHNQKKEIITIKNYILIFSVVIVASAFPAKFILEIFLAQYIDATSVIFFLFGAQIFYINIKSIYVNLYKAQRLQRKYFVRLVTIIGTGFLLNIFLWLLLHNKESFAIGTLLSSIIWYLISIKDFDYLNTNIKATLFPLIALLSFLITGIFFNAIIGFIFYLSTIIFISLFIFKEECKTIIRLLFH